MTRTIPGMINEEGREVLYIETNENEGFRQLTDKAFASCSDVPMPQHGGMIEEKAHILLDDGSSLLGVSYRGDIPGWRRKLTAYCEFSNRKWGVASNQIMMLSDGTEIDLCTSKVTFED